MRKVAFISYSSRDRPVTEQICDLLEKHGIGCWISPRDLRPGRNYGEEIISGIETTDVMVLILSEHANQSVHVRHEVERAVSKGKPVLPIRIREVQPAKPLELYISSTQWVDAWTPPLETKIGQLAVAIGELADIEPTDSSPVLGPEIGESEAEPLADVKVGTDERKPIPGTSELVEEFLLRASRIQPHDPELLVGRDEFLEEVRQRLKSEPVLSICGPTGIGETTIGLRLVRDARKAGIPAAMVTGRASWVVPGAKEGEESLLVIDSPGYSQEELESWLSRRPASQRVIFLSGYLRGVCPVMPVPPLSDEVAYDLLVRFAADVGLSIDEQVEDSVRALHKLAGGVPLNLQMLAGCVDAPFAEELAEKAEPYLSKGDALSAQEFYDLLRCTFGEVGDTLIAALRRLPAGLGVRSLEAFLGTGDWPKAAGVCARSRLARYSDKRISMGEVLSYVRGPSSFYSMELARHMMSFLAKYAFEYEGTDDPARLDELDGEWPNIRFAIQQAESFHEWPTVVMMCEAMLPYLRARGTSEAIKGLESKAAFARSQPATVEEVSMTVGPDFEVYSAPQVKALFATLLERCKPGMILTVDLSSVQYLDSTALGVLIKMEKRVRAAEVNMHLLSPSPSIRRVFSITGLDKIFDILPDIPYSEMARHT